MKADESRLEPMVLLSRGLLHDINNHLAPVLAYPGMVRESVHDPDTLEMLDEIERGAKQTSELVRHMQIILRCGAGLEEEEFDLNDLLQSVGDSTLLNNLLSEHPEVTILRSHSLQTLPVKASRGHLQQAVFLLVRQQVCSFSQRGKLELSCGSSELKSVTWDTTLQPGNYAKIELRATGPKNTPIDMENKKVQLEHSFAQGIVRDLGGSIRVEMINGGSTTTIYLPLKTEAAETQPTAQAPAEEIDQRKTILVVDDLRSQRRITSLLLEDLGYHAVSVNCGEDAVEYLAEHNDVDLMLLDMNMGGRMDGYDTYEHSLAINPDLRCVLVSAFTNSERAHMTLDLGANGPLEKPFRVEELDRVVRDALAEAQ